MKKQTGVVMAAALAAFLVTGFTGPAHALGGYAVWQSAEDIDDAFGLGLKHQFKIVPIIGIEARATWLGYGDNDFGGGDASLNAFPLEAFGRAKLGLFYGGIGIGWTFFGGGDPKPDSAFTSLIAAGAEFTLLGLGGFAELGYRFLEPEVSGVKVDLNGVAANVGVIIGL